jgi:hypothetical protein
VTVENWRYRAALTGTRSPHQFASWCNQGDLIQDAGNSSHSSLLGFVMVSLTGVGVEKLAFALKWAKFGG